MRKSSASGRRMAQVFSAVKPVNGYHQEAESQLTIHSNGAGLDPTPAPMRLAWPNAFSDIVYASRAMDEIITRIERSRNSSEPMLITGETGTGKELIVRAIHTVSARHKQAFIPFNCGGSTPELIASELFGHQKGAFTSATTDCKGVFREADGATLFLDEIGELPLAAQANFLRCLEKGEVRPLGATLPIKVMVRVIAATNRDLEADVQAGRFRADLFHRLNKLRLRLLPLREHREDIPLLIEHFLRRHMKGGGQTGA